MVGGTVAEEAIWHDVECGSYREDLTLWLALADATGGPVADVGAGTGRVALALARAGHDVTGANIVEVPAASTVTGVRPNSDSPVRRTSPPRADAIAWNP